MARLPTERGANTPGIRHQGRRIAFAARRELRRNRLSGNTLHRRDHLLHRVAHARAAIQLDAGSALEQIAQRARVRVRQVRHMDVVADGGAIGSGVIRPEDAQRRAAHGRADGQGDQMSLGIVPFADFAVRIGAGGVEIAQANRAQAVSPIVPAQGVFQEQLGFRIGAGGILGAILADGKFFADSIDRTTGGEHQGFHAGSEERVEEGDRCANIVAVILGGVPGGFPHMGVRGEQNGAADAVFPHGFPNQRRVRDGALRKRAIADGPAISGDQVVNHDRQHAFPAEGLGRVTANITGAAGHQDWGIPFEHNVQDNARREMAARITLQWFDLMAESASSGTGAAVVTGASWSALSRAGLQVFSVISATVLARFVSPRAYGLAGMAQVVIGFAALFGNIGASNAIIREKDLDDDLLTSVFWLNLAMGVCVTLACWLSAPFVAKFYNEPALPAIFRALGLYFAISATSSMHGTLLNRNFQFARLAAADLLAGAASLVVGIVSAVLGAGVWSLVTGALASAVVASILLVALHPWRPAMRFSRRRLGPIFSFGLNLSGFNLVNYFSRNADNLLIGKYLGAIPLAYYNWGYTLMLYPLQAISWTLGRVLFPAFAQMQDDPERFRRAYLRACSTIAFVTFPLMAGLTVVAPEFIVVLLGPKWRPVAPVLRILAPVGMVQSVNTTVGHIYTAMGKTDLMLRWGLVFTGITVTGFVIGLHWGILGVASSYAIVTLLTLAPTLWIPFRLIRLRIWDFWIALWPITRATAAMAVATAAFRRLVLGSIHLPTVLALLVFVPFGAAVYFAAMYWKSRLLLADFVVLARAGLSVFGRVRFPSAGVTGQKSRPVQAPE